MKEESPVPAAMETEKSLEASHIEDAEKNSIQPGECDYFTPKEKKRLTRRIDIRLVIPLGCLYCISLLDRTNLGAASVAGYELSSLLSTPLQGRGLAKRLS